MIARPAAAVAALLALAGCGAANPCADRSGTLPVTVAAKAGPRVFCAELADAPDEQASGLMHRTDLAPDGGMLFAPYPAEGGPPRVASFWMRNTPTSLDILFIRPDRTIARVAARTTPFSEEPVGSGEPVSAVLEIVGGRAAALGIAAGDQVDWREPKG